MNTMAEAEIAHTNQSTRTLLLGIWGHLSRRRRIQLGLLLVVMLASGGAELVSLGAVLPFLAVLSDPERLWQQPLVQALAARVGFTQASELLLPATLAFEVAAVLAAVLPFLAVLANPEGLWNQPLVQQWAPRLGFASAEALLLPSTIAFAVAALAAGAIRLLNLWLNGRLAAAIGSDLSCEGWW